MTATAERLAEPFDIAILAFDQVEALDLGGPYEVFTTASRVARKLLGAAADTPSDEVAALAMAAHWRVRCVAESSSPVAARAGLRLLPDVTLAEVTHCDLLVVPGGVMEPVLARPDVLRWVSHQHAHTRITASVCTGAFVLAAAGVVRTERVTTHWEDLADLRHQWPALQVVDGPRWVDEGRVVTSAGISAGIDMSLHLVERLAGRRLAEGTARQMDFAWQEN
ncbi:DJ-1/PfpI family protein [Hydrogenophaga sp. 5NK40-0174]|uniref:DJ-1/PfpI family protein n=1 Tax=Hydrogenophaga sp. 5NK40-0174 TaxID=3127649 RepID=UPI003107DDAD